MKNDIYVDIIFEFVRSLFSIFIIIFLNLDIFFINYLENYDNIMI